MLRDQIYGQSRTPDSFSVLLDGCLRNINSVVVQDKLELVFANEIQLASLWKLAVTGSCNECKNYLCHECCFNSEESFGILLVQKISYGIKLMFMYVIGRNGISYSH